MGFSVKKIKDGTMPLWEQDIANKLGIKTSTSKEKVVTEFVVGRIRTINIFQIKICHGVKWWNLQKVVLQT